METFEDDLEWNRQCGGSSIEEHVLSLVDFCCQVGRPIVIRVIIHHDLTVFGLYACVVGFIDHSQD
jgi:hypothetical protein